MAYVSITAWMAICGALIPIPNPMPVSAKKTAQSTVDVVVDSLVSRPLPTAQITWPIKITGIYGPTG
jgi:hypothetical protein